MTIRSHTFTSSGAAYNRSQTDDNIKSGDVLLVPSEDAVAVLVDAWPVLVGPSYPDCAFDHLKPDTDWQQLEEGRFYNSAVVAIALKTDEGMKAAGLGRQERLLDIARSYGWVDGTD